VPLIADDDRIVAREDQYGRFFNARSCARTQSSAFAGRHVVQFLFVFSRLFVSS